LATNAITGLAVANYGWDHHEWDLNPNVIQATSICAFASKLTYILASTFCRLSLVCFYYRLVRDSSIKWFYKILHVELAINAALGVAFLLMTVFACT
jgi:hypothetical protein